MSQLKIYQVDSFTSHPCTGNPAGVVPDARGLDPRQMQAIARELNNSETAFIFPRNGLTDDVTVRFFTPTAEVPVCGHATIAAHFVLALEDGRLGMRRQLCGAGSILIETEQHDGHRRIWMHQRPATFEAPLADDVVARLLAALGLAAGDIRRDLPIEVVSTGHSKVVIPVARNGVIAMLQPDMSALAAISAEIGCNGFYPFYMDFAAPGASAYARMFAPAIGIPEDPVTGNASGCLGAYLLQHSLLAPDAGGAINFVAFQGLEIGRPGSVLVSASRSGPDGEINIKIAGHAVLVMTGMMVRP